MDSVSAILKFLLRSLLLFRAALSVRDQSAQVFELDRIDCYENHSCC
jgi:hypothetical protein